MHDNHVPGSYPTARQGSLKRYGAAIGAALLLAMIEACPESAAKRSGSPSSGSSAKPVPAPARHDAGVASNEVPAALENTPSTFRDTLRAINRFLSAPSWNGWEFTADGPKRKQRLAWLAKDFAAPSFRHADRVDEAHLHRQTAEGPLHVGLLVVRFPRCKQLADARAAIRKTGRSNFALPVLTMFRTNARGHELVFVFSETPLHSRVDLLFKHLADAVGTEATCAEPGP
jgi:hypothetical protein